MQSLGQSTGYALPTIRKVYAVDASRGNVSSLCLLTLQGTQRTCRLWRLIRHKGGKAKGGKARAWHRRFFTSLSASAELSDHGPFD